MGIDVRASTALITRIFCKSSDQCNLLILCKRKYLCLIFQQNDTLSCNLGCLLMILFTGKFFVLTIFCVTVYNIQDTFYCKIQCLLFQTSFLYCLDNRPVIRSAASRHLQIHSGNDSFDAVPDSTPIRHHVPFESPVISENVCQKPFVF